MNLTKMSKSFGVEIMEMDLQNMEKLNGVKEELLDQQDNSSNSFKSVEEQLDDFEKRNMRFDIISKNEALDFLKNNTYLHKISLYKENFYTNNKREFVNLDFAYLKDLSTIDMHLRYTFLKLCLDIEHGIKTSIIAYFNNNNPTDGFTIVNRFIQSIYDKGNWESHKAVKLSLLDYAQYPDHHMNDIYKGINNDTKTDINIWELIECVSISDLIKFFIFFNKSEQKNKTDSSFKSILYSFRHLRNICAHNTPFLINVRSEITPNKYHKEFYKFSGKKIDIGNQKIMDIASLLHLHYLYVTSEAIKEHRKTELNELVERLNKYPEYYENSYVKKLFNNIKIIVDIYQE